MVSLAPPSSLSSPPFFFGFLARFEPLFYPPLLQFVSFEELTLRTACMCLKRGFASLVSHPFSLSPQPAFCLRLLTATFFQTGYSDYQIYLLLSCAPVQGHVAGIVDIPNACTTMGLPMDIFDFDISPHVPAKKRDLGTCAFVSK